MADETRANYLKFDGVDDYVTVPDEGSVRDMGVFTYSAWVYPTADGDREILSKSGSKRELRLVNQGDALTLRGCVVASFDPACSNATDGSLVLDQWQHVAMTYDDGADRMVHLFIDGQEVSYTTQSQAVGTLVADAGSDLNLGRRSTGGRHFAGDIDDVRVWSRALSVEEIQANAEPNLVAYWKLDEGTGQIANDSAANSHHGTLGSTPGVDVNDPTWVTDAPPVDPPVEPPIEPPVEPPVEPPEMRALLFHVRYDALECALEVRSVADGDTFIGPARQIEANYYTAMGHTPVAVLKGRWVECSPKWWPEATSPWSVEPLVKVPEPSGVSLLLAGVILLVVLARRKST
jgi:hypothetical protein